MRNRHASGSTIIEINVCTQNNKPRGNFEHRFSFVLYFHDMDVLEDTFIFEEQSYRFENHSYDRTKVRISCRSIPSAYNSVLRNVRESKTTTALNETYISSSCQIPTIRFLLRWSIHVSRVLANFCNRRDIIYTTIEALPRRSVHVTRTRRNFIITRGTTVLCDCIKRNVCFVELWSNSNDTILALLIDTHYTRSHR